nr:MAG TPA: hypothetical protein [Caudoviricetes sp.]
MAIFEEESNASQDGNYREHLNRNWHNGNIEFDKIEGLLDTLEKNLSSYHEEIDQLKTFFNNLKDQHTQDVDTFNQTIKKQNDRISKLEDAVFGCGEFETNYETPKTTDHVFEINTDSNPKLKGE